MLPNIEARADTVVLEYSSNCSSKFGVPTQAVFYRSWVYEVRERDGSII